MNEYRRANGWLVIAVALLSAQFAAAATPSFQVDSDQVALGDAIALQVTITNDGAEPIDLPALEPDGRDLHIWVEIAGMKFEYLHKSARARALQEVKPGERIQAVFSIVPPQAGSITIEAKFGETTFKKTVKVTPGPKGEDRAGVRIETTKGSLVLRFFPEVAPNTVLHFLMQAKKGFYNGLGFHRVIPEFMMQGGDPEGTGSGGPGYTLPAEFSKDVKYAHKPGRIAMARTRDPHSAGSQFYICFGAPSHLDGMYTVFGEVVEGMTTVKAVEQVGTESGDVTEKVTMLKAEVVLLKSK